MSSSEFSSEQSLKWLFTSETLGTRPTSWFVALHTGDPGNDGASNEVGDANYARQAVTFSASQASAGDIWEVTNDADVTFPSADSGFTVAYVTVFDSLTGGNALAVLRMPIARSVGIGGGFTIPINELVISGYVEV